MVRHLHQTYQSWPSLRFHAPHEHNTHHFDVEYVLVAALVVERGWPERAELEPERAEPEPGRPVIGLGPEHIVVVLER